MTLIFSNENRILFDVKGTNQLIELHYGNRFTALLDSKRFCKKQSTGASYKPYLCKKAKQFFTKKLRDKKNAYESLVSFIQPKNSYNTAGLSSGLPYGKIRGCAFFPFFTSQNKEGALLLLAPTGHGKKGPPKGWKGVSKKSCKGTGHDKKVEISARHSFASAFRAPSCGATACPNPCPYGARVRASSGTTRRGTKSAGRFAPQIFVGDCIYFLKEKLVFASQKAKALLPHTIKIKIWGFAFGSSFLLISITSILQRQGENRWFLSFLRRQMPGLYQISQESSWECFETITSKYINRERFAYKSFYKTKLRTCDPSCQSSHESSYSFLQRNEKIPVPGVENPLAYTFACPCTPFVALAPRWVAPSGHEKGHSKGGNQRSARVRNALVQPFIRQGKIFNLRFVGQTLIKNINFYKDQLYIDFSESWNQQHTQNFIAVFSKSSSSVDKDSHLQGKYLRAPSRPPSRAPFRASKGQPNGVQGQPNGVQGQPYLPLLAPTGHGTGRQLRACRALCKSSCLHLCVPLCKHSIATKEMQEQAITYKVPLSQKKKNKSESSWILQPWYQLHARIPPKNHTTQTALQHFDHEKTKLSSNSFVSQKNISFFTIEAYKKRVNAENDSIPSKMSSSIVEKNKRNNKNFIHSPSNALKKFFYKYGTFSIQNQALQTASQDGESLYDFSISFSHLSQLEKLTSLNHLCTCKQRQEYLSGLCRALTPPGGLGQEGGCQVLQLEDLYANQRLPLLRAYTPKNSKKIVTEKRLYSLIHRLPIERISNSVLYKQNGISTRFMSGYQIPEIKNLQLPSKKSKKEGFTYLKSFLKNKQLFFYLPLQCKSILYKGCKEIRTNLSTRQNIVHTYLQPCFSNMNNVYIKVPPSLPFYESKINNLLICTKIRGIERGEDVVHLNKDTPLLNKGIANRRSIQSLLSNRSNSINGILPSIKALSEIPYRQLSLSCFQDVKPLFEQVNKEIRISPYRFSFKKSLFSDYRDYLNWQKDTPAAISISPSLEEDEAIKNLWDEHIERENQSKQKANSLFENKEDLHGDQSAYVLDSHNSFSKNAPNESSQETQQGIGEEEDKKREITKFEWLLTVREAEQPVEKRKEFQKLAYPNKKALFSKRLNGITFSHGKVRRYTFFPCTYVRSKITHKAIFGKNHLVTKIQNLLVKDRKDSFFGITNLFPKRLVAKDQKQINHQILQEKHDRRSIALFKELESRKSDLSTSFLYSAQDETQPIFVEQLLASKALNKLQNNEFGEQAFLPSADQAQLQVEGLKEDLQEEPYWHNKASYQNKGFIAKRIAPRNKEKNNLLKKPLVPNPRLVQGVKQALQEGDSVQSSGRSASMARTLNHGEKDINEAIKRKSFFSCLSSRQHPVYTPNLRLRLRVAQSSLSSQNNNPQSRIDDLNLSQSHRWWQKRRIASSLLGAPSKRYLVMPEITPQDWRKIIEWQLKTYFLEEEKRLQPLVLEKIATQKTDFSVNPLERKEVVKERGYTKAKEFFKIKKIAIYLPWTTLKKSLNKPFEWPVTGLSYQSNSKLKANFEKRGFNAQQQKLVVGRSSKSNICALQQLQVLCNSSCQSFCQSKIGTGTCKAQENLYALQANAIQHKERSFLQSKKSDSCFVSSISPQFKASPLLLFNKPFLTPVANSLTSKSSCKNLQMNITKKQLQKNHVYNPFLFEQVTKHSYLLFHQLLLAIAIKQFFHSLYKVFGKVILDRVKNSSLGVALLPIFFNASSRSNQVAIFYALKKRFKDLVGSEDTISSLSEIVWYLRNSCRGRLVPRGVVLVETASSESTDFLKAIGGEAQVPVIVQSLRALPFTQNHPQRRLEKILTFAQKKAPCILFLDDLDAIGQSRTLLLKNNLNDRNGFYSEGKNALSNSSFNLENFTFSRTRKNSSNMEMCRPQIGKNAFEKKKWKKHKNDFNQLFYAETNSDQNIKGAFKSKQGKHFSFGNEDNMFSSIINCKSISQLSHTFLLDKFLSNNSSFKALQKNSTRLACVGKRKRFYTPSFLSNAGHTFLSTEDKNFPTGFSNHLKGNDRKISFKGVKNQSITNTISNETEKIVEQRRVDLMLRLLTVMDGISHLNGVLIVTTSKNPSSLGPALLRPGRFERLINLKLPNKKRRIDLLKVQTSKIGYTNPMPWDYFGIRTEDMTGAEIASAINHSAFRAIMQSTPHTVKTLEYGITSVNQEGFTPYPFDSSKAVSVFARRAVPRGCHNYNPRDCKPVQSTQSGSSASPDYNPLVAMTRTCPYGTRTKGHRKTRKQLRSPIVAKQLLAFTGHGTQEAARTRSRFSNLFQNSRKIKRYDSQQGRQETLTYKMLSQISFNQAGKGMLRGLLFIQQFESKVEKHKDMWFCSKEEKSVPSNFFVEKFLYQTSFDAKKTETQGFIRGTYPKKEKRKALCNNQSANSSPKLNEIKHLNNAIGEAHSYNLIQNNFAQNSINLFAGQASESLYLDSIFRFKSKGFVFDRVNCLNQEQEKLYLKRTPVPFAVRTRICKNDCLSPLSSRFLTFKKIRKSKHSKNHGFCCARTHFARTHFACRASALRAPSLFCFSKINKLRFCLFEAPQARKFALTRRASQLPCLVKVKKGLVRHKIYTRLNPYTKYTKKRFSTLFQQFLFLQSSFSYKERLRAALLTYLMVNSFKLCKKSHVKECFAYSKRPQNPILTKLEKNAQKTKTKQERFKINRQFFNSTSFFRKKSCLNVPLFVNSKKRFTYMQESSRIHYQDLRKYLLFDQSNEPDYFVSSCDQTCKDLLWGGKIAETLQLLKRASGDWYRLYLPRTEQNKSNREWLFPDTFLNQHIGLLNLNALMQNSVFDNCNPHKKFYLAQREKSIELSYYNLILTCFYTAFQSCTENRELLDLLADHLIRFKLLRLHEIMRISSFFY